MVPVISCIRCKAPLSVQAFNTFALIPCPACEKPIRADVYPALFRNPPSGHAGDPLQTEREAGCFYHSGKKAVVSCSACGRFLCALCDVELNNRHLCPACLEKGKARGRIKNLETHRVCYDKVTFFVALISMLFIWPTIVAAPVVIFMVIRYWRAPGSIIPRSKIRFILAFGIACLQIAGWILVLRSLISA
jgi:hypothetical protein